LKTDEEILIEYDTLKEKEKKKRWLFEESPPPFIWELRQLEVFDIPAC